MNVARKAVRAVGDIIDAAIGAFSPEWAAHRRMARFALDQGEKLIGFREASGSRLDRPVAGRGASADWDLELGFDRRILVDRARQLERDNLLAGALLDRSTENVVGDGFRLQAKTDDEGWNDKAHELWKEWSENEADVRGINTFNELLELVHRSTLRDGDAGAALLASGSIRLVESDEIAAPEGGYTRPTMADGVELDEDGKPVAYHVFKTDPKVLYSDRRLVPQQLVRIPAKDFVFTARRTRAGQTRGLTAFNGLFWLLEQLDNTLEAVTVAHRMAACFGLVIKKKAPFSGLNQQPDSTNTNRPVLNFEPASVGRLEPDEDIVQIKPEHPSANFSEHLRILIRLCGTRFGIPLGVALGDFSQSNFTQCRAELTLARKCWKRAQQVLRRFASEVYKWKIMNWVKAGKLPARADALKHKWICPGWEWVDPVADLQAMQIALDVGAETWAGALGQRGYDWEETFAQQALERKRRKKLDLPDTRSTFTRDSVPAGAAAPGAPREPGQAPRSPP